VWARLRLDPKRPYALVTLHRPSNVDHPETLARILDALEQLSRRIDILWPVHPRTKHALRGHTAIRWLDVAAEKGQAEGLLGLEPLGYLDCLAVMSRARIVLTDSGGIQEETTVLGIPCLTLRANTERPVTVTHGTNRLIGAQPAAIVSAAYEALERSPVAGQRPPLWDGHASERIVDVLAYLGATGGSGHAVAPAEKHVSIFAH
jgi:UDP-N-acetylglucosamine 2-epimerase (non-hydrolysing)